MAEKLRKISEQRKHRNRIGLTEKSFELKNGKVPKRTELYLGKEN